MFGRTKIKNLQDFINLLEGKFHECQKELALAWETERKQRKIADGLRQSLADAVNKCRDIEQELEVARELQDDYNDKLDYALSESKELNHALLEENKDLTRIVELLRAVLGQLQINVDFPSARKTHAKRTEAISTGDSR